MTLQHQQVSPLSSIERTDKNLGTGLDLILSHFEDPLFPRKISTYKTKGGQFSVSNKQDIINAFRVSNWLDCRVNVFSPFTNYKEVQICPPTFIFIDLDKNDFQSSINDLKCSLSNTLKNINETLGGHPTILFTGGGYHIYQPVLCPIVLENVTEFKNYDKPSQEFLRFAKDSLSNGKADKQNNPSFKSCLLRIPGSINSKYDTKVKIVQKWNGIRVPIPREFMEEFRTYLIQKKTDFENYRQKILEARKRSNSDNNNINFYFSYDWIETKVLQRQFSDYRKLIVGLILVPYLVVIKKLSYEESYKIISDWLQKCASVRKLDFDPKYLLHNNIKTSMKKLIPPISLYKLETNYRNLYLLLKHNNKNNNDIKVKEAK